MLERKKATLRVGVGVATGQRIEVLIMEHVVSSAGAKVEQMNS